MKTRNSITTLVALSLMLGMSACKKKDKGTKDPGVATTQEAKKAEAKKEAEAQADFEKAVDGYDKAMADGSVSGGECNQTASAFERVYKDHGERMQIAYFNAASIREKCGELDKAKGMYEELAKGKEPFHLALNNLGVMAWNRGDTKKAMEYFEKSVEANKKLAFAARNNLAAGLRNRYTDADKPDIKVFEQAELQIQNVLAVDTSNKGAYENLARLYYDRGRLADRSYLLLSNLVVTQAISVLKESGEESADLFNLAGLLRMQEDDQIEALKAFKRATKANPQHTDSNLNIAFISIRFRDYATAEASLAIALKDPAQAKNLEAILAMGVAKRGLKKFDESKKFYTQASKLAPKDPRSYYNLGILQHEHVSATKDSVDDQKAVFKVAKGHYKKFVDLASGKKWSALIDDAKGRMLIIDDAMVAFDQAEAMAKKAKELEALEKKQAAEETARLLELEKAALAAEEAEAAAEAAAPAGDAAKKPEAP